MAGNALLFLFNGGYSEDVASCLLKEVPKAWMERHRPNRGFGFQFAFMDGVLYDQWHSFSRNSGFRA